jgi:hypothetical protein
MKCRKCGRIHKFYRQFGKDSRVTAQARKGDCSPLPEGNAIVCDCGAKVDLAGLKKSMMSDE